jgi:glycosyltransferase involved in cell wall biosynthesis
MKKLSAVIITFNEEKKLGRCLESLRDIADEIVIVDSNSTDKTQEIAQEFGARFFQHPFEGYGKQKNYALNLAQNDFILSLDADEALSPALLQSIKEVKDNPGFDAYSMNRLTNYAGKWVKHCGWYPDRKIRLFNRKKAQWTDVPLHEYVKTEGSVGFLKGDILHFSYDSIADHIIQTNKFTTIAAKEAFSRGKKSNLFKILTRPVLQFLRDYFLKLGFLDGRVGYTICKINALSAFLKYSKLKDLDQSTR